MLEILVGLPACGKTTWAEKFDGVVVSSDAIRKEINGDENNQSNGNLVFETVYKRVENAIRNGQNVCLDCTNLSAKDRRRPISIAKNHRAKVKVVVFALPFEECLKRNSKRKRVVPMKVYERMLLKFQMPQKEEGIDEIYIVYDDSVKYVTADDIMKQYYNLDQQNHHHTHNLGAHTDRVAAEVKNLSLFDSDLHRAAAIHDIGKPFTKSLPDENGDCHYFGHANYGAYLALCGRECADVVAIVNFHMLPFLGPKPKWMSNELWHRLLILNKADMGRK